MFSNKDMLTAICNADVRTKDPVWKSASKIITVERAHEIFEDELSQYGEGVHNEQN